MPTAKLIQQKIIQNRHMPRLNKCPDCKSSFLPTRVDYMCRRCFNKMIEDTGRLYFLDFLEKTIAIEFLGLW